ncbi:MAG: hypothetical protein ACREQV_07865 [Candidatus Binatia bacterium]
MLENQDVFKATIGGLGLTGLITWVELQLRPLASRLIDSEYIQTSNIRETARLIRESLDTHEYVVASLDSAARPASAGRGLVIRGNHRTSPEHSTKLEQQYYRPPRCTVPCILPFTPLTASTITVFSTLAYHWRFQARKKSLVHYDAFFYPQDAIGYWNRLYGRRGFLQYQCQLPHQASEEAVRELLSKVRAAGVASPITTLKPLGKKNTPALLSFPRPGLTLALDFPNSGKHLFRLLDSLDATVRQAAGCLYPAKDARMSPSMFRYSFPEVDQLIPYIDPAFSSSFWRRVYGR